MKNKFSSGSGTFTEKFKTSGNKTSSKKLSEKKVSGNKIPIKKPSGSKKKGFWRCSCGTVNKAEDLFCSACGAPRPAASAVSAEAFTKGLKAFAKNNQVGMAFIIGALLFSITIILNPKSFNSITFGSILSLASMLLIASAGQTLVIISDGIDMSVGANMSMSALVAVAVMHETDNVGLMFLALVICLAIGAFIGFCNGVGSVKAGLPPMVVTLYISNIVTRLQYVLTDGRPEHIKAPDWFISLVTTRIFGFFPHMVFIAAFFFIVVFFLLSRTRYGRQLTLTGNNNRAAYLTGIRTVRIKIINYTVAGLLCGMAGFVGAANSSYIKCGTYDAMTLQSIVAVVIGGTLLSGGKGSYTGTVAGALLFIILSNGLAVLQVSDSIRNLIMGVVLIILLAAYNRAKSVRQ